MTADALEREASEATIVVDASVAASWCFDDEASTLTEAVLDEVVRYGARVPSVWLFEMANVLAVAERRGRVDADRVTRLLEALLALPVDVDRPESSTLVPALVRVARAQELSAYDASYLELAMRTGLPLATRDASLRTAAARVGVPVFEG